MIIIRRQRKNKKYDYFIMIINNNNNNEAWHIFPITYININRYTITYRFYTYALKRLIVLLYNL